MPKLIGRKLNVEKLFELEGFEPTSHQTYDDLACIATFYTQRLIDLEHLILGTSKVLGVSSLESGRGKASQLDLKVPLGLLTSIIDSDW